VLKQFTNSLVFLEKARPENEPVDSSQLSSQFIYQVGVVNEGLRGCSAFAVWRTSQPSTRRLSTIFGQFGFLVMVALQT